MFLYTLRKGIDEMKTVLKVVYIAIALVAAVVMYFGFYSSFAGSNYTALLTKAIKTADETQDYDDIARAFSIFSTPLEDEPEVLQTTGNNENITFVYSSVNKHNAEYTNVDGKDVYVDKVNNVYLFTILHPTFQRVNTSDTNQSAVRFYGDGTGEKEYYDYFFTISSKINSEYYVKNPTTEKDAILSSERTLLTSYSDFDLIFFPITETTAGFIEESIGSITGFNVIDNSGATVYSETITFAMNYTNEFFSDMAEFVKQYNIYLEDKNENYSRDYTEEELIYAQKYQESFTANPSNYISDFDTKYIQGIAYEEVYTGANMVMKTLGIDFLFLFAVALIYILLFHLKWIKKFVARFSKKAEEPARVVPNRAPKAPIVITKSKAEKSKAEELKSAETTIEVTPVEEAPVEETPVEEAPVEEAPVEEAPVEEAPVEGDPAEKEPKEE